MASLLSETRKSIVMPANNDYYSNFTLPWLTNCPACPRKHLLRLAIRNICSDFDIPVPMCWPWRCKPCSQRPKSLLVPAPVRGFTTTLTGLLYTPYIANRDLWQTSGHLDFYQENMFEQMAVEAQQYQLKPMNCPFHVLTYQHRLHSYRELPMRWAELGTLYRYERSGVLHGLMRAR